MNQPIQALSSSTRNTIRSTQILTSLPQIVSELLQNALDADARHVDVGFDKDDWSCWVRDDGHGISKDGMLTLAQGNSEEGRYATSKAYDPDSLNVLSTFGFRGEALASAANLCCLEIASRTAMSRETWSIILKGGKTLYTGAAVRWRRESPGTTVVVRDAFYNLPVRRSSHPSSQRTFELVRREIETYALVFPQVSFSLGHSKEQTPSDATLKIPKTPSALLTFQHLFGKALVQHVDTIDVCSGDLRLEGFISLDGAQSKNHQFLYINKHPIALGELHKLIDSKFSGSSFAKHAYDEAGESNLRPMVRRSPRKTEKRPVYVLNMTVPPRQIDNCLEPAKLHLQFQNKNAVVSLLSSAIQSFLVRHGFLIHTSATKARYDTSPPPRKRRRYEAEDDSGYAEALDEGAGDDDDLDFESLSKPLFIRSEKCLGSSGDVLWTDRNTGELFVVDSRTGNSRPQGKIRPGDEEDQAESTEAKRLTFSRGHPTANKEIPKWIQDALAANEVYAPTETKIPSVNSTETIPKGDVSGQLQYAQSHGCHRLPRLPSSAQVDVASSSTAHRYRKEDLLNANVINQVDKKFIACLINDTGRIDAREMGNGRALVLIDQHAADERVRVEQFLRPLCLGFLHGLRGVEDKEKLVKTKDLSPTRPILLTSYEASRLAGDLEIRKTFHNWGFEFGTLDGVSLSHGDTESGYVQVMVERIPEVVSDKLLAGDELRDLVKAVLANPPKSAAIHVEDDAMIPGSTGNGTVWLKALRWCPRELLELVNSKACRGAIMFNDTLTIAQCEKLVRQLAETVFPFQCAHGRPSLVPLTDISSMRSRPNGGEVCWSRLDDRELY